MAYQVTLATLMQRVRQRSNLEGARKFITDPELIDNINGSLTNWNDEVRGATWTGQYQRSQYPFQTLPAQPNPNNQNPPPGSYYPLPQDFLAVQSVDCFLSNSIPITCTAFQEEQRNMFRAYPVGWFFGQPIFYQIWGNNIVFIPLPQSVFSVQLNYIPITPSLSSPLSTIDSINGWEEFIVLDAAIKCLIKDGQLDMIAVLQSRLEQERARIRSMAPRRDMMTAEQVHEVAYAQDSCGAFGLF